MSLREGLEARAEQIRKKIAAREGRAGYELNVEAMKIALGELERLLGENEDV